MATDPTKNSADPVCEWSATLIERDKLKVAVKKAVGCIRNGNPDYALEILEDAIDV